MPFVLVEQLGFFMVPATVAICWGLFSIEEIGHYIEEPFRRDTNQLPLDRYVKNIMADVERLMKIRVNTPTEAIATEPSIHEVTAWDVEEERRQAARVLDELREYSDIQIQRSMAAYEEL